MKKSCIFAAWFKTNENENENENRLKMKDNTRIQFAFGTDEERCESDKFDSVQELLEYAQSSWDEMDGNPFDEDCEYSGLIWVGVVEDFEPADFVSLDGIADDMTDKFYCQYPIDDNSDVQILNKEEAKKALREFANKYFDLPCRWTFNWFGVYDLTEHKWHEKYKSFGDYVKD